MSLFFLGFLFVCLYSCGLNCWTAGCFVCECVSVEALSHVSGKVKTLADTRVHYHKKLSLADMPQETALPQGTAHTRLLLWQTQSGSYRKRQVMSFAVKPLLPLIDMLYFTWTTECACIMAWKKSQNLTIISVYKSEISFMPLLSVSEKLSTVNPNIHQIHTKSGLMKGY